MSQKKNKLYNNIVIMSKVIDVQYYKHIYIKNKYTDDYFEGYKISTIFDSDSIISACAPTFVSADEPTLKFPHDHTKIKNLYLMISDTQDCCEVFGVKFTGSILNSTIEKISFGETHEDECIINIHTNKGLCEFVIYNEHNGYYPHTAYFSFNDYVHVERL